MCFNGGRGVLLLIISSSSCLTTWREGVLEHSNHHPPPGSAPGLNADTEQVHAYVEIHLISPVAILGYD